MTTLNKQEALREALDKMETALATPIMAGELTDWLSDLHRTWNETSRRIHEQVANAHPQQFQQIANEDPEMLPRVDKLKREDQAIDDDRQSFDRSLARVAEHAPKFERDEEKLRGHTAALIDAGEALVHRMRKHEIAVQSWFVEAFNRDRGVAD